MGVDVSRPEGVAHLRRLAGLLEAAAGGFDRACDLLHRDEARAVCRDAARRHRRHAQDLAGLIGDEQARRELGAGLHRALLRLHHEVFEDDRAVLEECLRGERHLADQVMSALRHPNPTEASPVLARIMQDTQGILRALEAERARALATHAAEVEREAEVLADALRKHPTPPQG